jgi:Cys-rich four helix bundle protein (predicted Tat secretion target)
MSSINRRNAILTTGSMFVSASLGAIACGGQNVLAQATPPVAPPGGHHHHGGDPAVFEAAHACLTKGDACVAHCLGMLASGDTSMADCGRASRDMSAVMVGVAAAASSGSTHLADLARVAIAFCKDCEAACRKHADTHAVCRECAEACTRAIAAFQKVAG